MSSIVRVEAISGVQGDGPLCYLLQVDQVFILLDCGWDEQFDLSYIEAVKRRIPQISAIVLSYADIPHIGALPYLVGKCGLKCPIYATIPVYKMGQLFLQDWLQGHKNVEEFTLFDSADIDAAFDNIQHVKYNQLINLKGDNGLQIMPLQAGHMIGGAMWRITKMGEEEIVYAVDFNHRKERHLNGCTFDGIGRPHLLITDAFSALYNQQKRKTRDELLLSKLMTTLREGGEAMVVIDTAGRVLEVAHLLDQMWQRRESGLMSYNLVMLNNVASGVLEAAKSQVEWMSDKILQQIEAGKSNPFQLRHLRCCHSLAELNTVRSPRVVLVSGIDMESGFSRELFLQWCTDPKNIVVVTGRSGDRTLGSKLIRMTEAREQGRPISTAVNLGVKRRIRLEGAELEAYRARKRQEADIEARIRLENARRNIRMELSESSDESDEEFSPALNRARLLRELESGVKSDVNHGYDLMARFEHAQKTSFFKKNKKQFPMFPYIEEKIRWDDYGQIIKPEDYTLVETTHQAKNQRGNQRRGRDDRFIKKEEEEDELEDEEEGPYEEEWPTKCISYSERIEIICKVEFIDFEGRADAESIKKIIGNMKPKQLVLVHGGAAATRALANFCEENNFQARSPFFRLLIGNVQEKIFTPQLGEVIDATVETHIFQVTLSDPLMSSLMFQTVRDVELSWVDARIKRKKIRAGIEYAALENAADDFADVEVLDQEATERIETAETAPQPPQVGDEPMDDEDGMPLAPQPVRINANVQADELYLEVLPANNIPSHEAVFVNDPKLTDLKVFLMGLGYAAEFSSGVLYVNDTLSVTRGDGGRFLIEGPACEAYFQIRSALYTQFAIV